MDLSFARRLERARSVARLDYPRLIAILAAAQATSKTARAESRIARDPGGGDGPLAALVELLDPRGRWMAAAAALAGSFSPVVAARRRQPT